jgi:hypothetical protein
VHLGKVLEADEKVFGAEKIPRRKESPSNLCFCAMRLFSTRVPLHSLGLNRNNIHVNVMWTFIFKYSSSFRQVMKRMKKVHFYESLGVDLR